MAGSLRDQRAAGVALAGFMGVGKSTVAPLVAARLGLDAVDLDDLITERLGVSIATCFRDQGEAAFRDAECAAVRSLTQGGPAVVALGGGAWHHGPTRAVLAEHFVVVSLLARWSTVAARLEAEGGSRPLAGGARDLYLARGPGYLEADAVVSVDGCGPERVADAVTAQVKALEWA